MLDGLSPVLEFESAAHEIEVDAAYEVLELPSRLMREKGAPSKMRRSASTLELIAEALLPRQHWYVIVLLGAWRALTVGTLHAYHSVRIELVMSAVIAPNDKAANQQAGALMASCDTFAMIMLLSLGGLVTRHIGLRPLLVCAPLCGLASCIVLFQHATCCHAAGAKEHNLLASDVGSDASDVGGDASSAEDVHEFGPLQISALLMLSLIEIVSPIVPLALVPAAAGDVLGAAYGALEFMFQMCQMAITLSLGVMRSREEGGFTGALKLVAAGFTAATLIALPLMARTKRQEAVSG